MPPAVRFRSTFHAGSQLTGAIIQVDFGKVHAFVFPQFRPRKDLGDGAGPFAARVGIDTKDDRLVGWQDEEYLFLKPEAAFHAVSRFARDSGEPCRRTFPRTKQSSPYLRWCYHD